MNATLILLTLLAGGCLPAAASPQASAQEFGFGESFRDSQYPQPSSDESWNRTYRKWRRRKDIQPSHGSTLSDALLHAGARQPLLRDCIALPVGLGQLAVSQVASESHPARAPPAA